MSAEEQKKKKTPDGRADKVPKKRRHPHDRSGLARGAKRVKHNIIPLPVPAVKAKECVIVDGPTKKKEEAKMCASGYNDYEVKSCDIWYTKPASQVFICRSLVNILTKTLMESVLFDASLLDRILSSVVRYAFSVADGPDRCRNMLPRIRTLFNLEKTCKRWRELMRLIEVDSPPLRSPILS